MAIGLLLRARGGSRDAIGFLENRFHRKLESRFNGQNELWARQVQITPNTINMTCAKGVDVESVAKARGTHNFGLELAW